jgi:hypothetical protein
VIIYKLIVLVIAFDEFWGRNKGLVVGVYVVCLVKEDVRVTTGPFSM